MYNVNNCRGARIPLAHNKINVASFRDYLNRFKYPHTHILQYVEFGFPLGLWSDSYLEPSTSNRSSSYSYFSYIDKFVETELGKLGMTGPFDIPPWDNLMLNPMMTSHKKPSSRKPVFDASFGMFSLNKNTPEKSYHETEYEFHFPSIDNLADIIAELDKLGFVWRGKFFLFVSFVWGCRHAGYAGQ